jgi:putative transposase
VLNRAAGRFRMLKTDKDFIALQNVLVEAHERVPLRILAYCLMGNHWHFVVHPREDGELSAFFGWMTRTHSLRWRVAHRTVGYGALYQGRYKNFPIQRDAHLESVLRYVERNALSADLVKRAEDWRWGSLWIRQNGSKAQRRVLSDWPIEMPADWTKWVNRALTTTELYRIHRSRDRGQPLGSDEWTRKTVTRLGLGHTMRREGRPRKAAE